MFSLFKNSRYILFFWLSVLTTQFTYAFGVNPRDMLPLTCDIFGKDITENDKLPRNFRSAKDEIEVSPGESQPRLDGLKELPIAGTAQFTEVQLQEIANHLQKKVLVVDLREETHLILEKEDGSQVPITAYASQNVGNFGKTLAEIEEEIRKYKNYILEQGTVTLYHTKDSEVVIEEALKQTVDVFNIYSEKEIVERLNQTYDPGLDYKLLPLTDHKAPLPHCVDDFIYLFKHRNTKDEFIFMFHCQAGRGRTGLIMVMADIVENAKKHNLSFEEILKRQALLGSPDFSVIKSGRQETSLERFRFLQHFYDYVLAEDGLDSGVSYSFWQQVYPIGHDD